MLKGLVLGIALGVLLVCGGAWFYFTSGSAPVAVTDPPMPFEKRLAKAALHAHIGKEPLAQAPFAATDAAYLAGAQTYRENCAVCHGLPGGTPTSIADGMYPRPPQLFRGTGVTDDPAGETYWKAKNGIRMTGMPGFQNRLSDTQLWQVSLLLANADKISPAVKSALAQPPAATAVADPAAKK